MPDKPYCMPPGEAFALSEMLSRYRSAYLSDAHRARHDQQGCTAPPMSDEERQKDRAQERVSGEDVQ